MRQGLRNHKRPVWHKHWVARVEQVPRPRMWSANQRINGKRRPRTARSLHGEVSGVWSYKFRAVAFRDKSHKCWSTVIPVATYGSFASPRLAVTLTETWRVFCLELWVSQPLFVTYWDVNTHSPLSHSLSHPSLSLSLSHSHTHTHHSAQTVIINTRG